QRLRTSLSQSRNPRRRRQSDQEEEEVKEQEEEEVKEQEEEEEQVMDEETETVQLVRGSCVAVAAAGAESAGVSGEDEDAGEPEQQSHLRTAAVEDEFVSEQKSSTPTAERPGTEKSSLHNNSANFLFYC
ncbi:histone H3.v1-like, partial [Plectropomus leopardus]|uniref:histone H3.v1-like n=1 Tax=Plectropomus leopardus TaxID=160734 RepID=UPI001C4AB834